MKKKDKNLYLYGGLAVAGIAIYFMMQNNGDGGSGGGGGTTAIPAAARTAAVNQFKYDVRTWLPDHIAKAAAALSSLSDADLVTFVDYWGNYHIKGIGGQASAALRDGFNAIVAQMAAAGNWPK